MRNKLLAILLLIVVMLSVFIAIDHKGEPEQNGVINPSRIPTAWQQQKISAQAAASQKLQVENGKQILFGDLHVHTTYSMDAFAWSLPALHGTGMHPPSEACDYARFCSNLDFWSTNDHAEGLTPRHWQDIKNSTRQCNAVAGDPNNPDLVSFLGWEWTQMGNTTATHYGHRNVIFKDTDEAAVPKRPIAAASIAFDAMRNNPIPYVQQIFGSYLMGWEQRHTLQNQTYKMLDLKKQPLCQAGVNTRELPTECIETADTPKDLFKKLDEWGFDSLVIPHGTTWGYYTPPGAKWDKQLTAAQHDADKQRLIEIFSGHGNSEEHRDWRAIAYDADGNATCPAPSDGYTPCCHRAGEIIQSRCDDPQSAECQTRVTQAKHDYLAAGRGGHLVIPGVEIEDWQNCGQCPDCYLPALNYRPGNAVQAINALSNFKHTDENGLPQRFRFGFIAASDNHAAQPGTGYKETGRHHNTEINGALNGIVKQAFTDRAKRDADSSNANGQQSVPLDLNKTRYNFLQVNETERLNSFFYTGGLVAVHSAGRDRNSIWQSLKNKEVYGTSGDRILLWFDHLDENDNATPMGHEIISQSVPRFRVKALGAFEQKPGCPEHSIQALGAADIQRMCGGECYYPSDTRKRIDRIEVIRIRPQNTPGEALTPLIEDPWKTLQCADTGDGCQVEFADPDYPQQNREISYYVRAIQHPTPTINGAMLRCEEKDAQGYCKKVQPCHGDTRTALDDDCLAPAAERAWSSPIFVRPR